MTDIYHLDIMTTVGIQGVERGITERSCKEQILGNCSCIGYLLPPCSRPAGRNDKSLSSRQRRDLGIHFQQYELRQFSKPSATTRNGILMGI